FDNRMRTQLLRGSLSRHALPNSSASMSLISDQFMVGLRRARTIRHHCRSSALKGGTRQAPFWFASPRNAGVRKRMMQVIFFMWRSLRVALGDTGFGKLSKSCFALDVDVLWVEVEPVAGVRFFAEGFDAVAFGRCRVQIGAFDDAVVQA